jgi:hypothetical protein
MRIRSISRKGAKAQSDGQKPVIRNEGEGLRTGLFLWSK